MINLRMFLEKNHKVLSLKSQRFAKNKNLRSVEINLIIFLDFFCSEFESHRC